MAFTRTAARAYASANLHASTGPPDRPRAEAELRLAAERSLEWAAALTAHLRRRPQRAPARTAQIYDELAERFGLAAPTAPDSIDHLLVRGLETVAAPQPWPSEQREIAWRGGLRGPALRPRPGYGNLRARGVSLRLNRAIATI